MENIFQLDLYRHRKPKAQAAAPRAVPPDTARFFCLSCDTDEFKLYATGAVHCSSCGALIRNISITDNA